MSHRVVNGFRPPRRTKWVSQLSSLAICAMVKLHRFPKKVDDGHVSTVHLDLYNLYTRGVNLKKNGRTFHEIWITLCKNVTSLELWFNYSCLVVWSIWTIFPFSWEFHHPNWRTPSFFRGVGQPPTSIGYHDQMALIRIINEVSSTRSA